MVFKIEGVIKGGKNNMMFDPRSGRHYPRREWAKWRDGVVMNLKLQRAGKTTITSPQKANIIYVPQDRRRRDIPMILDSIWHCLERAEILSDDVLIKDIDFKTLPVNKDLSGVVIDLDPIEDRK